MRVRRLFPPHPFLFAAYPVLFLYGNNTDLATPTVVARSAAVLLLLAGLLLAVARVCLKNSAKANVCVSVFLILFFSFWPVMQMVDGFTVAGLEIGRIRFVWPLWGLGLAVIPALIARARSDLRVFSGFLGAAAVALVCMSVVRIGIGEARWYRERNLVRNWGAIVDAERKRAENFSAPLAQQKPDIYYIVLDEYAREDLLKSYYNYDNNAFTRFLTDRGFFVASTSWSNYAGSIWSLASSLNYDYLHNLGRAANADSVSPRLLREMIKNNKVSRVLKDMGYSYVYLCSGFAITSGSPCADVNVSLGWRYLTEFDRVLINNTFLRTLRLPEMNARSHRLCLFERLGRVPQMKEPTFTFAHIVCPHYPWIFDRAGRMPSLLGASRKPVEEKYIDQLVYVTSLTRILIDRILAASDVAPIIILQADHGPWNLPRPWRLASDEELRSVKTRTSILHACYFPGEEKRALYDSITPVNSFRVVLNEYFGANYELLDDSVYFPKDERGLGTRYDPANFACLRGLDSPSGSGASR